MRASFRSGSGVFHFAYIARLMIIIGITFLCGAVLILTSSYGASALLGLEVEQIENYDVEDLEDQSMLYAMKIIQGGTQLGFFLLPSLLVPLFFGKSVARYLKIKASFKFWTAFISICVLLISLPLIQLSMFLNQVITFPEHLAWLEETLRERHEQVEALSMSLLKMDGPAIFLVNVLLIAIIPAIAEEFYFRGMLQNFFSKWSGKRHLAVWIAAILFSAIHMQFFAFLPRLLLGAMFGYMLLYTGNIWYPVIAHFFNNFMVLCVTYFIEPDIEEWPMGMFETYPYFYNVLILLFAILLVFTLYQLSKRKGDKDEKINDNWVKVYTTLDRHQAQILKGMLESHQITAVIMDKRDSAYMAWGELHIYTNEAEASRAEELIRQHEEAESNE